MTTAAPERTDETRPAPDGEGLFDQEPFTSPVPELDGHRADKITLRIVGKIELDLMDDRDLAIARALTHGREATIVADVKVDGQAWKTTENADGEQKTAYTVTSTVVRLDWAKLAKTLGVDS